MNLVLVENAFISFVREKIAPKEGNQTKVLVTKVSIFNVVIEIFKVEKNVIYRVVLFIFEQHYQTNILNIKQIMNKNIYLQAKIEVIVSWDFLFNLNIKKVVVEVDFVIYLRDFYFAIFWENEVNLVRKVMKDFRVKHL